MGDLKLRGWRGFCFACPFLFVCLYTSGILCSSVCLAYLSKKKKKTKQKEIEKLQGYHCSLRQGV